MVPSWQTASSSALCRRRYRTRSPSRPACCVPARHRNETVNAGHRANEQKADVLRAVKLARGTGDEINRFPLETDREMSYRLHPYHGNKALYCFWQRTNFAIGNRLPSSLLRCMSETSVFLQPASTPDRPIHFVPTELDALVIFPRHLRQRMRHRMVLRSATRSRVGYRCRAPNRIKAVLLASYTDVKKISRAKRSAASVPFFADLFNTRNLPPGTRGSDEGFQVVLRQRQHRLQHFGVERCGGVVEADTGSCGAKSATMLFADHVFASWMIFSARFCAVVCTGSRVDADDRFGVRLGGPIRGRIDLPVDGVDRYPVCWSGYRSRQCRRPISLGRRFDLVLGMYNSSDAFTRSSRALFEQPGGSRNGAMPPARRGHESQLG